jgi:hypothetical protein
VVRTPDAKTAPRESAGTPVIARRLEVGTEPLENAPCRPRAWTRSTWLWAALAVILPAVALAMHLRAFKDGDITRIFQVTRPFYEETVLCEVYPPGEITFEDGPYDGLWFLGYANDPLLLHRADHDGYYSKRFYRGRRIAWPWAGWLLGAGSRHAIPYSLPIANLLLLGVATWALARLLVERGRHPAWSLLYPLSLGAAVCTLRPLSDLFATSWMILGCYAWVRRRPGVSTILFIFAVLSKETTILAPFVLGAMAVWRRRLRPAAWLLLVPAAMGAWWIYLTTASPLWRPRPGMVGKPLIGLYKRIFEPWPNPQDWENLAFMAVVFGLAAIPLAARRYWDEFRLAGLAFAALALVTQMSIWGEYWGYGRIHMTIPAMLLFAYALHGRRIDLGAAASASLAGVLVWSSWI